MSPWLAIDTSSGTSVAIVHEGRILAEVTNEDTMGHAENIGHALIDVLKQAKLTPAEISAVVVGRGPAPFTGLRVGIAAAIAFAQSIGRPLFGVPSHHAIANAAAQAGENGQVLVVTDARRKEVYWSVYRDGDLVEGPHVSAEAAITSQAPRANQKVSAGHLGLAALRLAQTDRLEKDISALYLRAPDATEPKSVKR